MEVRTRALAMAEEREEEAKRMKFDSSSSSSLNHQQHQHKNHRRPLVIIKSENIPASPENSTTRVISSDRCSTIITSCREQLTSSSSSPRCSSNESYEIVMRSADIDPESEGFRLENSTYFVAGDRARREVMTQSSDLISEESIQMPSSSSSLKTTNSLRNSSNTEKMPSEAEIESFFSEIEKHEQKRFTERYNYDFVKDVPLEGRFVWVPVKL